MKRTPLRKRSKTNSRKWENLDVRCQYMVDNQICELLPLFPMDRRWHAVKFGSVPHLVEPGHCSVDPHHICGGMNGADRWDVVPNLVAVCRTVHDWLHKYETDGWWLACCAKLDKGEFDIAELNRILGLTRPGASCIEMMAMRPLAWDWVEPIKESVLRDAR